MRDWASISRPSMLSDSGGLRPGSGWGNPSRFSWVSKSGFRSSKAGLVVTALRALSAIGPADIDAFRGAERFAQQSDQVLGRLPVGDEVDGVGGDVVVLIVGRLFFERVPENLQI